MICKMTFLCERLTIVTVLVWFILKVTSQMIYKTVILFKILITLVALVWFLSSVPCASSDDLKDCFYMCKFYYTGCIDMVYPLYVRSLMWFIRLLCCVEDFCTNCIGMVSPQCVSSDAL